MGTLTTTQIAWAAGFFDGEGCILPNAKHHGKPHLRVTVRQVDRQPLDWLKQTFGGSIETERHTVESRRTIHRWVVEFRQAREFLAVIQPYLMVKQKHPYFTSALAAA